MRVEKCLLAALLLVALPALAKDAAKSQASTVESVVVMQVNGWVDFDTVGRVDDYRIDTRVTEAIRTALDRTVRAWTFEPVRLDGVPRRAKTRIRVTLTAHKLGDGVQVKVDNVIFPSEDGDLAALVDGQLKPITGNKLRPPSYPADLLMYNVSGATLLAIRVGPDGQAAEVTAVQSMLFDVRGSKSDLRNGIRALERAALNAAKSWTFNVPASPKPRTPDELTVTVPVEFVMEGAKLDYDGKWRTVVRMPKRAISWVTPVEGAQTVGVADAVAGEVVPTRSAIALDSNVIGSDLL